MSSEKSTNYTVLDENEEVVHLTFPQLSNLVEHYNNKAGSCPLSIDDAADHASDTDNETRQTAYEFGIERDFTFS